MPGRVGLLFLRGNNPIWPKDVDFGWVQSINDCLMTSQTRLCTTEYLYTNLPMRSWSRCLKITFGRRYMSCRFNCVCCIATDVQHWLRDVDCCSRVWCGIFVCWDHLPSFIDKIWPLEILLVLLWQWRLDAGPSFVLLFNIYFLFAIRYEFAGSDVYHLADGSWLVGCNVGWNGRKFINRKCSGDSLCTPRKHQENVLFKD